MVEDLKKVGQLYPNAKKNKAPRTSKLSITLLHITQSLNQHFYWDVFVIREQVPLCAIPGKVDKRIGVRSDTGETSKNVALIWSAYGLKEKTSIRALVEQKDLFTSTAHPCFRTFSTHASTRGKGQVEKLASYFLQLRFQCDSPYLI